MTSNNQYTTEMYQYLVWRLFREMYGAVEWCEKEDKKIKNFVNEAREKLTDDQRKIVENRVRRMSDEYHEHILEELEETHWHDFHDDDYDYGEDDFRKFDVSYDEEHYDVWTQGVRKRQTVKMKYDSATSGMSERLVDPYKTSAPYGEGYCHNRKEVRKFRFDRIVDIKLTDKKFKKPDNWESQKRNDDIDAFVKKYANNL